MWRTPSWVHDGGTEPGMLLISEADTYITFTVAVLSTVLLRKGRNPTFPAKLCAAVDC